MHVRDIVRFMDTVNATQARQSMYGLIDEVNESSEPTMIVGRRHNAVLIGEDDWRAIQETLFLDSIPGMTESILKAKAEPLEGGAQHLQW